MFRWLYVGLFDLFVFQPFLKNYLYFSMHPLYGPYYKNSYNIEFLFAEDLEQKKKQLKIEHFSDFFFFSRFFCYILGRDVYLKYFDKFFLFYRSCVLNFIIFFFFKKVKKVNSSLEGPKVRENKIIFKLKNLLKIFYLWSLKFLIADFYKFRIEMGAIFNFKHSLASLTFLFILYVIESLKAWILKFRLLNFLAKIFKYFLRFRILEFVWVLSWASFFLYYFPFFTSLFFFIPLLIFWILFFYFLFLFFLKFRITYLIFLFKNFNFFMVYFFANIAEFKKALINYNYSFFSCFFKNFFSLKLNKLHYLLLFVVAVGKIVSFFWFLIFLYFFLLCCFIIVFLLKCVINWFIATIKLYEFNCSDKKRTHLKEMDLYYYSFDFSSWSQDIFSQKVIIILLKFLDYYFFTAFLRFFCYNLFVNFFDLWFDNVHNIIKVFYKKKSHNKFICFFLRMLLPLNTDFKQLEQEVVSTDIDKLKLIRALLLRIDSFFIKERGHKPLTLKEQEKLLLKKEVEQFTWGKFIGDLLSKIYGAIFLDFTYFWYFGLRLHVYFYSLFYKYYGYLLRLVLKTRIKTFVKTYWKKFKTFFSFWFFFLIRSIFLVIYYFFSSFFVKFNVLKLTSYFFFPILILKHIFFDLSEFNYQKVFISYFKRYIKYIAMFFFSKKTIWFVDMALLFKSSNKKRKIIYLLKVFSFLFFLYVLWYCFFFVYL